MILCHGSVVLTIGYGVRNVAKPFTIPKSKHKPVKPSEAVDVAARYLVYKLHVPGTPLGESWQLLSDLGEMAVTVDRAVARGWVVLREGHGKTKDRYAGLTDEGRMLARKALR